MEELFANSIEEKRLVETMITARPSRSGTGAVLGTLAVMLLSTQFYWSNPWGWSDFLPAVQDDIFSQGQWWRAFTAILIHADLGHLLSNLYMLGIFSFFVFGYFGFSIYPLWSFFLAGVVNVFAVMTYPSELRLLGASGLVYLLGGLWLTLYFLIQRQYRLTGRWLRVLGIALLVFFPTSFVPTTSYRTHAIGFVMGVGMAVVYFVRNKKEIRSHEKYKFIFKVESEDERDPHLP